MIIRFCLWGALSGVGDLAPGPRKGEISQQRDHISSGSTNSLRPDKLAVCAWALFSTDSAMPRAQ